MINAYQAALRPTMKALAREVRVCVYCMTKAGARARSYSFLVGKFPERIRIVSPGRFAVKSHGETFYDAMAGVVALVWGSFREVGRAGSWAWRGGFGQGMLRSPRALLLLEAVSWATWAIDKYAHTFNK